MKPKNLPAKSSEYTITLPSLEIVLQEADDKENLSMKLMGKKSSVCLSDSKEFSYETEADVNQFVHCVLQDAAWICCFLLDVPLSTICVRKESSLLTNKPDHSAIYVNNTREVLAVVEDKKDHPDATTTPKVKGQCFDYCLSKIMLSWHTSAIGALTSIEETKLCWLGKESRELLKSATLFTKENIKVAKERLSVRDTDKTSTPNAKREERCPTEDANNGLSITMPYTRAGKRAKRENQVQRQLEMSQTFGQSRLVDAFCTMIMAGILLNKESVKYSMLYGEEISLPFCLALTRAKQDPQIEELKVTIGGPAKKSRFTAQCPFYLVNWLGRGCTSKAFQVVTKQGDHCALKIYVQEYDGNVRIDDFDEIGRKFIHNEFSQYRKIYPSLSDYVWTEKLADRHCLVLPYFSDICEKDRKRDDVLEEISKCYDEHFVKNGCFYYKSDVKWRHVGRWDEKIFLFDLGSLATKTDEGRVENGKELITILQQRLKESSISSPTKYE